jgi:predicted 2-oxoglutarate/Fe(II)-dependent dioxygenase YbiX|tara:strand:+ start:33719 stop:34249 length:531 start_codon:yes stop_codon:yes gene_type:complete
MGQGKFDTTGLVEHIFSTYNLNEPPSDLGGYNILDDKSAVMSAFNSTVKSAFNDYLKSTIDCSIEDWDNYKLKGWITGHGKDYSMTIHNHSGAHLSGVFYILAEDQNSGGDLVLHDPRSNANRGYDEYFNPMFNRHHHQPETGDFLIFPSFAYHHVNPYYSELRICVPVDLYLYRD